MVWVCDETGTRPLDRPMMQDYYERARDGRPFALYIGDDVIELLEFNFDAAEQEDRFENEGGKVNVGPE